MLQEVSRTGEGPDPTRVVRGALGDSAFASTYSERMYRLRYEVFHERLRWDVTTLDGLEYDRFDDNDSVYMLTTGANDSVSGGWRLRPTTRGYMLRDVFPQLLNGHPAPEDLGIWEISRFAVEAAGGARPGALSLSRSARALFVDAWKFAAQHGIFRYVLVTSLALERLLVASGLRLQRFGPPLRMGRCMAVACWLDLDAHTQRALLLDTAPGKAGLQSGSREEQAAEPLRTGA
jgi:acyl homoserine lactone synthase